MTDSDTDLIKKAQAYDTEAFCSLAQCHWRRIYLLAFHYCHNRQDAEDLSQEVWLKAYQALSTFRFDSSFYTWLRRITINTFLNHQRNSSTRQPGMLIAQLTEIDIDTDLFTSEETIYNKVLFDNVVSALGDLTPPQRLMFLLRHYEGMSYEEIAAAMNCSTGTAKKAVWRALGKLRAKFEIGNEVVDERVASLAAEY